MPHRAELERHCGFAAASKGLEAFGYSMHHNYPTTFLLRGVFIFTIIGLSTVAVAAQSKIRRVDFRNFTYPVYCGDGTYPDKMTVRKGKSVEGVGDERVYFDVLSVKYGDLTGDGHEEAIIRSTCNGGGTGHFFEGFVYTLRHGKPRLLIHIPGGDRAEGGIHGLSIARRLVVVELYANKIEGVGICCPDFIDTQRYRWNGRRLMPVGKRSRRAFTGWN